MMKMIFTGQEPSLSISHLQKTGIQPLTNIKHLFLAGFGIKTINPTKQNHYI